MARQSRRLRNPGSGGCADPLGARLVFECGRTAALRNGTVARRPRLPNALPSELLIAAGPGEWRAALLEDGIAVELYVERGDREVAGSIHLGRVSRLLPALGAMLVDIGGDRPAFLPQSEVLPRGRRFDEGQRAVVQIRREAQGGKAARVTTGVALRGRLVELRPGRPGVVIGEALSPEERAQLLSFIATGPGGLSQETAIGWNLLEPAPVERLVAEAEELLRRWRDVLDRA